MNTLSDIIALGDRAAAAGQPLVEHWAPTRGCLQLLGHSCGRLDQVAVRDFDTRFPEKFSQLPAETQGRLPDASAYEKARRAVSRLLAMLGHIDDPWEALRLLIRDAGRREDIEYHWGGLKTPATEAGLAPIRKPAEEALLRPQDITPAWLDGNCPAGMNQGALVEALNSHDERMAVAQAEAIARHSTPVAQAWQSLRDAARLRGLKTSRLGIVITPAINDNLQPGEIDRAWATQVSRNLPHRQNAKFRMAVRALDAMRDYPELALHLSPRPIGPLPDHRTQGSLDLPENMARELAGLHEMLGSADSTRREGRAIVRKLYTAASKQQTKLQTLRELLAAAEQLSGDARVLRKSRRLLEALGTVETDAPPKIAR